MRIFKDVQTTLQSNGHAPNCENQLFRLLVAVITITVEAARPIGVLSTNCRCATLVAYRFTF